MRRSRDGGNLGTRLVGSTVSLELAFLVCLYCQVVIRLEENVATQNGG